MNLQGEKHVFFMGKTQLVPAGYVVNKFGLGGVGVGPQQNRNSHIDTLSSLKVAPRTAFLGSTFKEDLLLRSLLLRRSYF